MQDVRQDLIDAREKVRDKALSLLNDAVYRGNDDAKKLERQCAKISRALDKAIHEIDNLNKMTAGHDDENALEEF